MERIFLGRERSIVLLVVAEAIDNVSEVSFSKRLTEDLDLVFNHLILKLAR